MVAVTTEYVKIGAKLVNVLRPLIIQPPGTLRAVVWGFPPLVGLPVARSDAALLMSAPFVTICVTTSSYVVSCQFFCVGSSLATPICHPIPSAVDASTVAIVSWCFNNSDNPIFNPPTDFGNTKLRLLRSEDHTSELQTR